VRQLALANKFTWQNLSTPLTHQKIYAGNAALIGIVFFLITAVLLVHSKSSYRKMFPTPIRAAIRTGDDGVAS
jgi:hypothetical protein